MSIVNAVPLLEAAGGGDYTISRSVRLRSSASAYFNRTPASAGNRQIWTWSAWVKRGKLSYSSAQLFASRPSSSPYALIYFASDDTFQYDDTGGLYFKTNAVFRDPSAWYHLIISVDTTQATNTNRFKVYVNGVQQTFSTTTYPVQNFNTQINTATQHDLGSALPQTAEYFDGYLAEVNFIDGQQLTPSSFGQTDPITGVWGPKKYAGTYGTNGFYLNFSDNSSNTSTTIGKDYSGNGNNWTPNNISVTSGATYDSMIDTPTPYADGGNGRGNYCTLNPINATSAAGTSLASGNLQINGIGSGNVNEWLGTMGVSSGKWYYEVTVGENNGVVGISQTGNPNTYPGGDATSYGYGSATKYNNGSTASYGATLAAGDVVGVAYDLDGGTITFYKNGVSQGQAFSGLSGNYFPAIRAGTTGAAVYANFGQRPFSYTPPSGYVALNTQNLPAPTIKKGGQYFNTVTYTGNATARSITGVGFQPDLVWIKNRTTAFGHLLYDAIRGTGVYLASNSTAADTSLSTGLTSFDSDGFGLGTVSAVNENSSGLVAWNWKANGAGSSNTNGSITSTVSVNAAAGFSIATYTGNGSAGATFGHGLGVAPNFVIVKERGNANGWLCYHVSTGNTGYLELDETLAFQTLSTVWNNTTPSSTVVTLGTVSNVNRSGGTFVAYCWSAVKGFSAFGSYTGNGSADGPFVYTGFRPRFVMLKRTDAVAAWVVLDTSRDTYNAAGLDLYPNASDAEVDNRPRLDILSNGFKQRANANVSNLSGGTYIYACFAENPFRNALAR